MVRESTISLDHGSGRRLERFREDLKAKIGRVSKTDKVMHIFYGKSTNYH